MANVNTEITNMQNQTTANNIAETRRKMANGESTATDDKNMFLNLMLQQLQNQDPTEPTSNTEWLAQLAQYSSLEQMTSMNEGLTNCMNYISALYNDMGMNSEITQTLSMIGKEVTLKIPDEKDKTKYTTVKGTVSEASFEDGTGKVKVGDKYYSIANVISIRESDGSAKDPVIEEHTVTAQNNKK